MLVSSVLLRAGETERATTSHAQATARHNAASRTKKHLVGRSRVKIGELGSISWTPREKYGGEYVGTV
jgi:hypothetical protein